MFWGKQSGSSMLELIAAMTLAGVAMASAAPALRSLESAAHRAKIDGAIAAVHSANHQAHAAWLLAESSFRDSRIIDMEGEQITLHNAWISVSSIAKAAGIDCNSYGCIYENNHATFTAVYPPEHSAPCFVYQVSSTNYSTIRLQSWNDTTLSCE